MNENGLRGFPLLALIFAGLLLVLITLAGLIWINTLPAETALVSPTETIPPTASATPSATATATRRPTWTSRPSASPSITPSPNPSQTATPARLATLVSARPNRINENYVLATWDAALASEAARRMRENPEIVYKNPADRETQAYSDAFIYTALIYQEALLRYPDDPQAQGWQWGLAYSLARTGDVRAVEYYAAFLLEALEKGSLPLENLPAWFNEHEPALHLAVHKLPSQPGQLGQALLEVEGGIWIWMLQTPEGITLYPLTKRFDFRPRPSGSPTGLFLSAELTGDAVPELVLYTTPPNGDFSSPEPRVFDLRSGTPVEQPVAPALPVDNKEAFLPELLASDQPGGFEVRLNFYAACPVRLSRAYGWDGTAFIPGEVSLELTLPAEGLERCETILAHAETHWEPRLAAQIAQALLPAWPPKLDLQGRLQAEDARLGLQYRLGLSLALAGDQAGAKQTFQAILDTPEYPQSEWKTAARAFLSAYLLPVDLYRACLAAPGCQPAIALPELLRSSGITNLAAAQEYLRTSGATIRSAGVFDFDNDGSLERWVTVQHRPGDRLEFWILAPGPQGAQALFLSYIETNNPIPYLSVSSPGLPVFQLAPRQGYRLLQHELSGTPYLTSVSVEPALTTYTRDALFAAEADLFAGASPNQIRRDLELVLSSGRFNCQTHAVCDRFYYLLGLAYELNGQPRSAIDTYLKLWWENRTSPLTTVARLKLLLITSIKPSPTKTSTINLTPSATPTSTLSPTPYPTAVVSPYPTVNFGYPTPTRTQTPTP